MQIAVAFKLNWAGRLIRDVCTEIIIDTVWKYLDTCYSRRYRGHSRRHCHHLQLQQLVAVEQ